MNDNPMLKHTPGNERDHFGVGNIVIPLDVDRAEFIAHCLNTSTVSILTQNEFISEVDVIAEVIDKLEFPEQSTSDKLELGSLVVFINEMNHNRPIIIGTINKSDRFVFNLKENENRVFKKSNDNNTTYNHSVQPEQGTVHLNLNSLNKDTNFIINVNGQTKGNFVCTSNGSIIFNANILDSNVSERLNIKAKSPSKGAKETNINYTVGTGLSYLDEFSNKIEAIKDNINIETSNTNINTDKFFINDGSEPMLLGNKTVSLIDKLISACEKLTIASFGTPPVNVLEFTALKLELETIKSSISFIN